MLRLYWVVPAPFVSRRITVGARFGKLEGFTQASRVIPSVGFRALLEGTITPELEAASKWKACSTSPVGKVTVPWGVPLFSPRMSLPFPSPGHQATMPGGGGIQVVHLPALPALKMPPISDCERARLMYSTSSITPEKRSTAQPHPLKLFCMMAPIVTGF